MTAHRPTIVSPGLRQQRASTPAPVAAAPVAPAPIPASRVLPLTAAERDLLALLAVAATALPGSSLPRLPQPRIARPRLVARLDTWAPVTVLQALPGAGKTTLVASWLAEKSPRDVTTLWVGGLSDSAAVDVDDELGVLLDGVGIGRSAPTAFGRLHNALLARPGRARVVLVLDAIAAGSADWDAVVAMTQRHRHFHLVVCGAVASPLMAAARSSVSVNVLTMRDLVFDLDEVLELAARSGRSLTRGQLIGLHEATGGWPAVVRLALDAFAAGDHDPAPYLAARYVREVLNGARNGVDGPLLAEIARFALTDRIEPTLIAEVCGGEAANAMIARARELGLIDRFGDGGATELQFATLVRDALRADYTDREPDAARRFHGQLAAWFAAQAGPDSAVNALRHAIAARDWSLVVRLWDERGLGIAAVHPDRLRTALRDLPAQVRDQRLSLRLLAGAHPNGAAFGADPRLLGECTRMTNQQLAALPLAELLLLGTAKIAGRRRSGDGSVAAGTELGELIDRIRVELATSADAPALAERVAWFEFQVGLSAALTGSRSDALRHYRSAFEQASAASAGFLVAAAAAHIALEHATGGHTALAVEWLDVHEDAAESRRRDGGAAASVLARGLLALDRLDADAVAAAVDAPESRAAGELWPYVAYLDAQRALHFGDVGTALARLAATEQAESESGQLLGGAGAELIARARADLLIAIGQGQHAYNVVHSDSNRASLLDVSRARLSLQSGDLEQCRQRAARASFDDRTSPRDRLELLLIHSVAALRDGDERAAADLFGQALAASKESGIVRVFATIDDDELRELATLADADIDDLLPDRSVRGRVPVYGRRLVLISLTKSERALIEALERSASRREIAEGRYVSLNTIKTQMRALYQKLGTSSRDDTLAKIRELGLLT